MKKQNNNKKFGLGKERQVKKILEADSYCLFVTRARGSFGTFDIQAYYPYQLTLISVKSTKQKYWSPKQEIKKIRETKVPGYCSKQLWIWWSPHKDRPEKKGWEIIHIP